MIKYKHVQVGYLMIIVMAIVTGFFSWANIMARLEAPAPDSGTNLLVTAVMIFILVILASFTTLTTTIEERCLRIKFGYGIFSKKFSLDQIASVRSVKNRWYYGWGIKVWFWPYMWIYNVSGFLAVEIVMKTGKKYRLGTDVPGELEMAIKEAIGKY